MNRTILTRFTKAAIAAAILFTAGSCAKPLDWDDPEGIYDGEMVTVTFSATGEGDTKATGITPASEKVITNWAVFAFDNSDGWFRYETSATAGDIPMKLWAGRNYTCYAIANYSTTGSGAFNPSTVRSASDLLSKVAYLGDNSVGHLMMFGSKPVTPTARPVDPLNPGGDVGSDPVTIGVARLISRIDVPEIRVDFSAKPYMAGVTFTLRAIYVTNAYRTSRYGSDYLASELSADRTAWYNSGGWHRGESAVASFDALLGDRNINTVVSASSPYQTSHSYYAFPNATTKGNDDHTMVTNFWSQRCTRIVIEATLDSDTVYYQITVPAMERNMIYSANNVVIRGRGSNDPEVIDIDPDVISVDLSVSPYGWETTDPVEENS